MGTALREPTVELARHRDIAAYRPIVGDIIIHYGWFSRTKWFGIISSINSNGILRIIIEGSMRLLLTTNVDHPGTKAVLLSIADLTNSLKGTYSTMQVDKSTSLPIWYI